MREIHEIDRLEKACRAGEPLPQSVIFEPLLEKISRRFDLADPGMNINAACASSTIALARGAAMITSGEAASVLVYAADIVSEFDEVNHNYEREHRYNLWFVVVARDDARLREVLAQIETDCGYPLLDLPLLREFFIDLGFDLRWT